MAALVDNEGAVCFQKPIPSQEIITCSFVLRCSLPSIGDMYVSSVIPFRQQPVKFFIFSTSYYCLKLHGLLENSTSKRIALKV